MECNSEDIKKRKVLVPPHSFMAPQTLERLSGTKVRQFSQKCEYYYLLFILGFRENDII